MIFTVKCGKCDKDFCNDHSLKNHQKRCGIGYNCSKCDQNFPTYNEMKKHLLLCNFIREDFECEFCKMKFQTQDSMEVHQSLAHGIEIEPSKMEETEENGRKGEKTTEMVKNLKCENCAVFETKKKYVLKRHMKQFHPTPQEIFDVKCICEECQTAFYSATELNEHITKCVKDYKSFR